MKNKKGFTLIEVLLIIVLVGMLATAAFSSFFDTSVTFSFISEYKSVVITMREARSYAITNKDSATYDRYGVVIYEQEFVFFGDLGTPYNYNSEDDDIKTLDFTGTDYRFGFDQDLPVFIYYDNGTGDLSAYDENQELIAKDVEKRLDFEFSDTSDLKLIKYFYIFQVSGIVEESNKPLT